MKLIRNPNPWSCMLCSVAMVLDMEIIELIRKIGHNGSKVVFPVLPEPGRRRGFHLQEFITIAIDRGFAVTPIEALPYATPDGKHEYPINFPDFKIRFQKYMIGVPGILTGLARQWRHAVAWNGKDIYDPRGQICSFKELKRSGMNIDIFWRFDQIKS